MTKNYKKYIAFLIYIALISVPVLYWINLSWGIGVLKSKQIFSMLLTNDFSFGLTILSALGALTVGIAAILMKQSQTIQTEREIYDANSVVKQSDADDFISTNGFLTPPQKAVSEAVSQDIQTEKTPAVNAGSNVIRLSENANLQKNFVIPKMPPPAISQSKIEMNFVAPIPNSAPPNSTSTQPKIDIGTMPEIRIEKEPIITSPSRENTPEIVDVMETKFFENILKSRGYKTFDVKMIDDFDVKFFAVSNKNVLFGYNMPFTGEIIANETIPEDSDAKHPYWFGETSRFMSPIFAVKHIRKSIDDLMLEVLPKDHDITIESYCIINDDARILNMLDMQESWDKDIINVVMNSKAFENIPTFESAVEDQTTVEIMPAFLEFAETMSKYFIQKARISSLKKHS
ncbi:MAG: hypothetical protein LBU68_00460 [Rickettsiales bacterium]|jgi:hypothetical protein|nr:hypothetical protein [Rickettsiales bacterium]